MLEIVLVSFYISIVLLASFITSFPYRISPPHLSQKVCLLFTSIPIWNVCLLASGWSSLYFTTTITETRLNMANSNYLLPCALIVGEKVVRLGLGLGIRLRLRLKTKVRLRVGQPSPSAVGGTAWLMGSASAKPGECPLLQSYPLRRVSTITSILQHLHIGCP